jgi:F-type H+-transporting ATPase subunit alpha
MLQQSQSIFKKYLDKSGEIGFIEEVYPSLVYASGLPNVRPNECVIFENGSLGQVISLEEQNIEILLFGTSSIKVGTKITRMGATLAVPVGDEFLGKIVDPLGNVLGSRPVGGKLNSAQSRPVDVLAQGITTRENVHTPLETGFAIVDLLVPLGMGQRELVIGDRKTGKTQFLLQIAKHQAQKGTVCIYAAIGKRNIDVKSVAEFFKEAGVTNQTIIVASTSFDSAGVIFLTPYTAMTMAEYFRDQGRDVLVILDDLTAHAQCYRQITLLAKRFPGRSSYPGDIFYVHSKLLERAGKYKKGSISCLPVVESVLGDLSGYIQTNIMAITDGHLFFDSDVFNEGRRPAINPYLSVTRVGEQAQTDLLRDLSRQLSRFLVHYQTLHELVHFGTEFEDRVRKDLGLGGRIFYLFNQSFDSLIPLPISILLIAGLWNGLWADEREENIGQKVKKLAEVYKTNEQFKQKVDRIVKVSKNFQSLVIAVREEISLFNV